MTAPVSAIPMMRITPSTGVTPDVSIGGDFGAMLKSAIGSALDAGHEADAQATKAITNGGNVTEVATALARAEMTLQTATAVRDGMLQAYQDIMKIQI